MSEYIRISEVDTNVSGKDLTPNANSLILIYQINEKNKISPFSYKLGNLSNAIKNDIFNSSTLFFNLTDDDIANIQNISNISNEYCEYKEIFEMTMRILEMDGQAPYAKKLRTMVPESHWESMVVTDYKGEV